MGRTLRIAILAVAAVGAACTIAQTPVPPLTGPSELGLSLAITATPDILTADGSQQSVINIVARDPGGQPRKDVDLRVDQVSGNTIVVNSLLSKNRVMTDSNGQASVTFTAPMETTPGVDNNGSVVIRVLPVSTDFGSVEGRFVTIRLVPKAIIVVPGAPIPLFTFSPATPSVNALVNFDASRSYDSDGSIVSYKWEWDDGENVTRSTPYEDHDFAVARTYNVKLTVKDNAGQESFVVVQVPVH